MKVVLEVQEKFVVFGFVDDVCVFKVFVVVIGGGGGVVGGDGVVEGGGGEGEVVGGGGGVVVDVAVESMMLTPKSFESCQCRLSLPYRL